MLVTSAVLGGAVVAVAPVAVTVDMAHGLETSLVGLIRMDAPCDVPGVVVVV